MLTKILINGGTGFIGSALAKELKKKNYYVAVLSRNPEKALKSGLFSQAYSWDDSNEIQKSEIIREYEVIINLAGEPVADKPLNDIQKKIIYDSRINSTRSIVEAIKQCDKKPSKFINASAVGFYGDRKDLKLYEDSTPGQGFLAQVCQDWEIEANKAAEYTKVYTPRIGFVLDAKKGGLSKMLTPFKLGIGGPLGSGKQYMPWIHIKDIVNLFISLIEKDFPAGVYNFTAPNPVDMNEFSKILGKIMHRPSLFKVPAFILKIILGERADIVLSSQRVYPKRVLEQSYKFEFESLENALKDILG